MNDYNWIVKAPTVIQPVPHGQPEVVTFDSPPVVEYANHFKTLEELEAYLTSIKYVSVQRPSENFIFTESSDNFLDQSDFCQNCLRFYPSKLNPLDRGRHSAKICPFRPVKCGVCGTGMCAKDYIYMHMWVCCPDQDQEERRAGVWMWSDAAKRDRALRQEAEERAITAESHARRAHDTLREVTRQQAHRELLAQQSIADAQLRLVDVQQRMSEEQAAAAQYEAARAEAQARADAAESNTVLWERTADVISRRESAAVAEVEQRTVAQNRELQQQLQLDREARARAEAEHLNAIELAKQEREARLAADSRAERAAEQARVWEEAAEVMARREKNILQDSEKIRFEMQQKEFSVGGAVAQERKAREEAEQRLARAEESANELRARLGQFNEREYSLESELRQARDARAALQQAEQYAKSKEQEVEMALRREQEAMRKATEIQEKMRETERQLSEAKRVASEELDWRKREFEQQQREVLQQRELERSRLQKLELSAAELDAVAQAERKKWQEAEEAIRSLEEKRRQEATRLRELETKNTELERGLHTERVARLNAEDQATMLGEAHALEYSRRKTAEEAAAEAHDRLHGISLRSREPEVGTGSPLLRASPARVPDTSRSSASPYRSQ